MPAQIAIGDDAHKVSVCIGDADAAKAFARHFDQRVRHRGAERDQRDCIAGMHDIGGKFEHGAEPPTRVQLAKIDGGKAAAFQ